MRIEVFLLGIALAACGGATTGDVEEPSAEAAALEPEGTTPNASEESESIEIHQLDFRPSGIRLDDLIPSGVQRGDPVHRGTTEQEQLLAATPRDSSIRPEIIDHLAREYQRQRAALPADRQRQAFQMSERMIELWQQLLAEYPNVAEADRVLASLAILFANTQGRTREAASAAERLIQEFPMSRYIYVARYVQAATIAEFEGPETARDEWEALAQPAIPSVLRARALARILELETPSREPQVQCSRLQALIELIDSDTPPDHVGEYRAFALEQEAALTELCGDSRPKGLVGRPHR